MNLISEGNKIKKIRERITNISSFFIKHSLNSDQCIFIEKELELFNSMISMLTTIVVFVILYFLKFK